MLVPAVILGAGLASASRAGAILLALESVAAFLLLGPALRRRSFAFAAAAIVAAGVGGAATLATRFAQADPLEYRREIFQSAREMAASRPWQGYGLGTFASVYPEFARFDTGAAVNHAHNDWLEWAAEGGIAYAGVWLAIALWAFPRAVRSGWGLGVGAVFVHALVDYPFARLGISFWVFILLAAFAREKWKSGGEKLPARPTSNHQEKTVKFETVQAVVAAALAMFLALAPLPGFAAPPAIGTVLAKGTFRIDDSNVTGNATLFEGTLIETRQAATSLDLTSGARVTLSPDSKGRIYGDHLLLEKGSGQLVKPAGFHMEARGLRVQPATGDASARVALAGPRGVKVTALSGSFHVLTAKGLLVADLAPGTALEFEPQPQAGGNEPWKISGCLRVVSGHYLVTDDVTNVTVEVSGSGLDLEAGNRVEITGTMDSATTPVSGATQFIRVTQVRQLGKGCSAGKSGPAASAAGAGGAAAGGAAAGISATTIAIIGGVAAAATVGGLAAADTLPGQGGGASKSVSR